ncbi:MAG: hypothetical protein ACPG7F_15735 [Aggregatilineales bacterium]
MMGMIRTSKEARLLLLALIVIFAAVYRFMPEYTDQVRIVAISTGAILALLLSPRGVMMGAGIGFFLALIVILITTLFMGRTLEESLSTLLLLTFLGAIAIPLIGFIQGNLDKTGNLRQITERENTRRTG